MTVVSVSLKTFCSTRRKEVYRIFCTRFDPQSVTGNESCNGNTNKLRKFPLIYGLVIYFILLLSEKLYFTAKYACIFYRTEQRRIQNPWWSFFAKKLFYGRASLRKSQENFIVDVRLGSKYASGIGFTVEKVHTMSIII